MKNIKNCSRYLLSMLAILVIGASCKKEKFVEANLNPETLYSIKPEDQFLKGSISTVIDFEYFADVYRASNLWMQYATPAAGNGLNFNNVGSQFNTRYGRFYSTIGPALYDGLKTIDAMPETDKAARVHMRAITQILLSYYGFYVSDINGSIPYSEAFQARYGGTTTPKYDTQQEVFTLVDQELKNAVAVLKSTPATAQVSLGNNDPFYGGDVLKWTKLANALRLKIALRLIKADPAKLKSVATEVLADNVQMSGIGDSWAVKVGPSFADANGNFNPATFVAGKPVVDFMLAKSDPRLRIFYRPNQAGNYVGSFTSPDDAKAPQNAALYSSINNFSQLQHRLFTPNYNENDGNGAGNGTGFYPFLTYAEYCFIRADMAARGVTADNAEEWYKKGVYASIQYYNDRAIAAKISNFTAVTTPEIDAYYNMAGVKFDPAIGAQQIGVQAYLEFYRQPLEAWAWWKRTGYPNTTSVLAWSPLRANGGTLEITRRAGISLLSTSNLNFKNQESAIAQMSQNPDFGQGPNDPFGRVWWDKK